MRCFRLLRLLKAAEYVDFIEAFDKTLRDHAGVLCVTASVAMVVWILSSAMMYYTERENPDLEMARYYQDIPSAMWITLLNLSGEVRHCFVSLFRSCSVHALRARAAKDSDGTTRSSVPTAAKTADYDHDVQLSQCASADVCAVRRE